MLEMPQPYPLSWPTGRARVPPAEREPDRYQAKNIRQALATLEREIKRWRAPDRAARIVTYELTTDPPLRGHDEPADLGAAPWFRLAGTDITEGPHRLMVLPCDKFRRLPQNVRAIALTMERLRLVDEVGAYSVVAALEGARALPPPDDYEPWRRVLQITPDAPLAIAEAAYRALARTAHADTGGADHAMRRLNLAIEAARRELG